MDTTDKCRAIVDRILPYIPFLLSVGSGDDNTILKELDKNLDRESGELAKDIWKVLQRAGLKIDSQVGYADFAGQLLEFLKAHDGLVDELEVLVSNGTQRDNTFIRTGDYSVAVGGDAINSNIINGSNNIIAVIERTASKIELVAQAEKFEHDRLKDSLIGYVNRIKSQTQTPGWGSGTRSPYKALLEYEISDSDLFFGRGEYVDELLDCIQRSALTVLQSASGAGKSSLLRAGIGPRLLAQGLLPLYVRPRREPALQMAIKQVLNLNLEQSPNLAAASLRDFLDRASLFLDGRWLVIIVDQFEELFTMQSVENRNSFVDQLATCLDDKALPVRWILSLRSEWFGQLAAFQSSIGKPFENSVFLNEFSPEDAYRVIVEPAKSRGVLYEDGLVDRIVRDLSTHNREAGQPDHFQRNTPARDAISPPQLQLVCSALFDATHLSQSSMITAKTYETLGEAKNILQEYLDRVINENILRGHRDLARKILTALVDDQRHRVTRSLSQLQSEVGDMHLEDTLKQLVDSHLLKTENEDQYELAHDYLTEKISLDPEMQKLKFARDLLEQGARKYEREGLKLSADDLKFLKPYLERMKLTSVQHALISASKKDETRRRYLSLLGFMATFSLGASFVIVAAGLLLRGLSSFAPEAYISMLCGSALIFAMVGSSRGWAKEILVSFGLILALAINKLFLLIPSLANLPANDPGIFWIRLAITVSLAYLGYQVVANTPMLAAKARRERLQDAFLGSILGAINGYFLIGSIWYYLHAIGYTPLGFLPPTPFAELIATKFLPPVLFGNVGLVIAVILMLIFVIIVFI